MVLNSYDVRADRNEPITFLAHYLKKKTPLCIDLAKVNLQCFKNKSKGIMEDFFSFLDTCVNIFTLHVQDIEHEV